MANPLVSLGVLLRQMLIAIAPVPPPTGQKAVISRTAVFLCVFVVVHAIGNLTAICGRSAFNDYAEMLHSRQIFLLVELYLGANVLGHAAMGIYKSFTNKFTRKSMGMDGGKFKPGAAQLILSGSALTVFLVIHVKQFRLGHAEVSGDVYTLARQTLADPKMAAGYCAAVAALGFHLWKGWGSVTFSLKLDSQHFANVLIIGRVVNGELIDLLDHALSRIAPAVATWMHAVIGAVALFYTAMDGKDVGLLSKMAGAEAAASIPAEAVALGAFAACGACSLPIVMLVSAADASGAESQAKTTSGQASAPSGRSASPAVEAGRDKSEEGVRLRRGAAEASN